MSDTLYRKQMINPLSPKIDQPEISPYNIDALEDIVVMRIQQIFQQILPTTPIELYGDSKWESRF